MAQSACCVLHAREAGGVFQQAGDFPRGGRQIVAANRGAFFEQVIGVAFFLAGNRFNEGHGKSAGERFGSGEAACFSDEQIGGGHVLVHFLCEAYRNKTRQTALQVARRGGNGVQLLFDVFGFAGDGYDLPRAFQGEQISNELFDRADAVSTSGDQNNRCGGIEAEVFSRGGFIHGNCKERINGDSSNANDFAGDADACEIFGSFGYCHVVAIYGAAEPHGVDVIVGDNDSVACAQFLFGDEPRDNFRRQEMSGDADVGLDALEHANHGLRVEAIDNQALTHLFPRLVRAVVENAHEFGRAADHTDVGFVVDPLKDAADVLDDVDVFDNAIAVRGERFFEGLRGADMSSAGGCREQENARFLRHCAGGSGEEF